MNAVRIQHPARSAHRSDNKTERPEGLRRWSKEKLEEAIAQDVVTFQGGDGTEERRPFEEIA